MPRRHRYQDTRERWGETRIITVNLPEIDLVYIEKFIDSTRLVPSRSEYVRVAVRNQILKDMEKTVFQEEIIEDEESLDPKKFVRVPGYNGNEPVRIVRRLE